jgi:hypothetical protein
MPNPKFQCPRCWNQLVKREWTFWDFYGCITFPKCKHTEPYEIMDNGEINIKTAYGVNMPEALYNYVSNIRNKWIWFTYVIEKKKNQTVKIWMSIDVISRLLHLNNELNGIEVIYILKTPYQKAFEWFLHKIFEKFLVEWQEYFDLPVKYIVEIWRIKSFCGESVVEDKRIKKALNDVMLKKMDRIENKQDLYSNLQ